MQDPGEEGSQGRGVPGRWAPLHRGHGTPGVGSPPAVRAAPWGRALPIAVVSGLLGPRWRPPQAAGPAPPAPAPGVAAGPSPVVRPAPPRRGQHRPRSPLPPVPGAAARYGPAAAARRRLPGLHPRHVRDRAVRPAPDVGNQERGEHPVPALPHHRCQQPELAGLRLPEAGLDADRRQHHRGSPADPLHPGVPLLQPREAPRAAAEPAAPGCAGHRLRLLHPPDCRRADAPGTPGALLQRLHHQHVPLAAG